MPPAPLHPRLDVPFALADLIIQAATEITRRSAKAYRIVRRRGRGGKAEGGTEEEGGEGDNDLCV